jgi:trigger factor
VDEIYPDVLKEAAVEPSGPGSLEEIISQDPPKFAFVVPLVPKVVLGDYHTIRKEFTLPGTSDTEVDGVIKNLRGNFSTAEPVERPVQEGDLVSVKISARLAHPAEGEDAEVIKETTPQMMVGENEYEVDNWPFEGFSRELVGMSAGETRTVEHSFPSDDVDEKLRGKDVVIQVEIVSIKAMNFPELNDEFAKSVGNYPDIETLRKSIRDNLEQSHNQEYTDSYMTSLIDQIIGISELHYPPQYLQEEIEHVMHTLEHDLEDRGMDIPTYLKTINKDQETFIESEIRPVAKMRMERAMVIDELARAEELKLDPSALQMEVMTTMGSMEQYPEFKKLNRKRMEILTQNVTMESATRLINRMVGQRLQAIATGQSIPAPVEQQETAIEPVEEPQAAAETLRSYRPGIPGNTGL